MPDDLWTLEQSLWTGDADTYERGLAPDALLVLPAPAGILDRDAAIESIRAAPRWKTIDLTERRTTHPSDQVTVLVYRAVADRGTRDSHYEARCSSMYVQRDGAWQLALHQQTPAA